MSFNSLILVGLGGFLGAITRYLSVSLLPVGMPYSIAFVNLLGCFLFGFFAKQVSGEGLVLFLFIGFLGSLTTFSSLISDTQEILVSKKELFAVANIFLQIIFGLLLFKFGNYISLQAHQ